MRKTRVWIEMRFRQTTRVWIEMRFCQRLRVWIEMRFRQTLRVWIEMRFRQRLRIARLRFRFPRFRFKPATEHLVSLRQAGTQLCAEFRLCGISKFQLVGRRHGQAYAWYAHIPLATGSAMSIRCWLS